jgi:putative Ca2+/H+ antiporter (TMEM165/GDT1 family)
MPIPVILAAAADMSKIAILAGVVVAVIVLVVAAISIRAQRASVMEERLGRYAEASTFLAIAEEEEKKKKEEKKPSQLTERLDGLLQKRSFGANWRSQLARADLKLTVSEYFALHVVSMIIMGFVALFLLGQGIVMTIVFGAIGIFLL